MVSQTQPAATTTPLGDLHIASVKVEPHALSLQDGAKYSGLSVSTLYAEMAAGRIKARKYRSKVLLLTEDLKALINGLPERQAA